MLPNVIINVSRNGLGQAATTSDSIAGLCLTGTAVADKLELNTPYAVYSREDVTALGITDATNPFAYRQLVEFYSTAGNGSKLWLIVAPSDTTLDKLVDVTGSVAKTLLLKSGGEVSMLGVAAEKVSGTVVDGMDSSVWLAQANAQLLADECSAKMMPFVALIEGKGLATVDVKNLREMDSFRTSIVAASTNGKDGAVGLTLGLLASLPVHRKLSRVLNGSLPIIDRSGYLTDGMLVDEREGTLNDLHEKGYIIFRRFPNLSGYFFNADFTATKPTDDLNILAKLRVMDKAVKLTYLTFVQKVDDDVLVDSEGKLDSAIATDLKSEIERTLMRVMAGEISSAAAAIDRSANILAGEDLPITLELVPVGYLPIIRVKIGFTNPLNNV